MYKIADVDNASMVSPNISDDKQGLAKYLWEKLPEICDYKSYFTLNTAELLPNMCDNHQLLNFTNVETSLY